jgi:NADH:ubiquinone oxidoreductase subunit D
MIGEQILSTDTHIGLLHRVVPTAKLIEANAVRSFSLQASGSLDTIETRLASLKK